MLTLESWCISVVGGGVLVSRTQPNHKRFISFGTFDRNINYKYLEWQMDRYWKLGLCEYMCYNRHSNSYFLNRGHCCDAHNWNNLVFQVFLVQMLPVLFLVEHLNYTCVGVRSGIPGEGTQPVCCHSSLLVKGKQPLWSVFNLMRFNVVGLLICCLTVLVMRFKMASN